MKGLLILLLVMVAAKAFAYETDQYSVPPTELADMGSQLSRWTYKNLQATLTERNDLLQTLPSTIQKQKKELQAFKKRNARFQLGHPVFDRAPIEVQKEYQRKIDRIAASKTQYQELQTKLGLIRLFRSKFAGNITWQEQRDAVFGLDLSIFENQSSAPTLYDQGKTGNVYALAGFHRIISPTYFVFSSTMRSFDIYFGTDKLGHFFNQGFQYWELEQNGKSRREIIQWGMDSENGVFGQVVDGVYSNADLAVNFAGYKFYQNLFAPLQIADKTFPAVILQEQNGDLTINPEIHPETWLAPFITNHFNEALNPSVLERPQRWIVRKEIKEECESWLRFYNQPSQAEVAGITNNLMRWHGEAYGYKAQGTLRIDDICY